MVVAYQGPLFDYSGYGEANRHAVAALHAAGITVNAQSVRYTSEPSDFGSIGKLMHDLVKNEQPYKVKIMHTTPDEFKRLHDPGKYNIAHFFWETDRVPKYYADCFQYVDEIWTGSEANVAALKKAGVDKPTYVFPQATEVNREWPKPYKIPDFDGFVFYSIFEWIDRKNPEALLKAFWQEFQNDENVCLLIKTYFRNFTLQNKRMIRNRIQMIKDTTGLTKFPRVFLYQDLMDRDQVMRVHSTGDAFVSTHHGEGWGVPQVEAMLAGNPIISTNYGGVHEYLEDGKDALLLPCTMVPVRGMEYARHIYDMNQNWADVDIADIQKAMRKLYDDQKLAKKIGSQAQKTATKLFNFEAVGKAMADRLNEIEASL